MPNVRLLVLIGYVVAAFFLQRYMLYHPPEPSRAFVKYLARCVRIVLALGVPLISPLIAYLWVDFAPLPLVIVVLLATVLPLGLLYVPWLWRIQVPKPLFFTVIVALIVLLVLLGILVWVYGSNDGRGITWALLPMLYFILIPPAFMLAMLYIWAPAILPLSPKEQRSSHLPATRLITGFLSTFPRPVVVVEHGELETRIAGNPFVGTGPGLLVTEPQNAVVRYRGTVADRVIGPGVFFTERGENFPAVIDLQGQFRATSGIEAQTRDNINVRVPCSSIFRIQGSTEPTETGILWTYNPEAALRAYLATEVNPARQPSKLEAHRTLNWADMPLHEAGYMIQHVLKRHTLDQIYAIKDPQPEELPRLAIAKEVREHVIAQMAAIGIQVTAGGVGNRIVPTDPAIVKQRLESWKAQKMQIIELDRGKAKAKEIEEQGRVRSEALVELTKNLQKEIEGLQGIESEEAKKLVTLLLLQTLDEIAQQPEIKAHLPATTTETLAALQHRASQS